MQHTIVRFLTIAAFLCGPLFSAQAVEVFVDEFDGDDLSNWAEMPQNASGLGYNLVDSNLVVVDFNNPWVMNTGLDGEWAIVTLFHDFTSPLSDFTLTFQFAWSSEDPVTGDPSLKAMQRIYVQAYDLDGVQIARTGYSDSWLSANGGQHAKVRGGTEIDASPNDLGSSGTATITITRVGSNVTVSWDGEILAEGVNDEPFYTIGILFYYYPYDGLGGPSFFGTESVDFVWVSDEPGVDVPPTSISSTTTTILCGPGYIDCGGGLCCHPWTPQCCGSTCCRADQMCVDGVCTEPPPCLSSTIYDDDSNKVQLLRKYRDEVLSTTPVGQEIIKLYYLWSPAITKAMEEDDTFKREIKELIDGVLPMIKGAVK